MYKVIKFFTDLKDHDHAYRVGDEFPRKGVTVSEDRLKELSTDQNKRGIPLIEAVGEKKAEPKPEPIKAPEVEIKSEKDEHEEIIAKEVETPKKGRKIKK